MKTCTNRSSSPWMPVYMDDLTAATYWWPAETMGVYMRLLIHQAAHGGVPNDDALMRAITGAHALTDETWQAVLAVVLPKFAHGADGQLRNARLEREMQTREAVRDEKLEAQERSAAARRQQAYRDRKREQERNAKHNALRNEHNGNVTPAIATTATTTTTPPPTTDVVVGAAPPARQLELPTALVPAPPPPRASDDDDGGAKMVEVDSWGRQLRALMGLPPRALSEAERDAIEGKRALLSTPENLERLAAWYPKGRKRKRRQPDALVYLIEDLETCLDQCARVKLPKTKGVNDGNGGPPPEFEAWLKTAPLAPRDECLRKDLPNAWLALRAKWRRAAAA